MSSGVGWSRNDNNLTFERQDVTWFLLHCIWPRSYFCWGQELINEVEVSYLLGVFFRLTVELILHVEINDCYYFWNTAYNYLLLSPPRVFLSNLHSFCFCDVLVVCLRFGKEEVNRDVQSSSAMLPNTERGMCKTFYCCQRFLGPTLHLVFYKLYWVDTWGMSSQMLATKYKIRPNCWKLKQSPHQSFLNSQSSNPLYGAKHRTRSWFRG